MDGEVARWLVSDAGRSVVREAIASLPDRHADTLPVATDLRAQGHPAEHVGAALEAALAHRAAPPGLDHPDLIFTRSALEQASDPNVSAWRARRFAAADLTVTDLCCAAGADAIALARASRHPVAAVDLDPARVVLCQHNADVLGLDVSATVGDATMARPMELVHADPSRRVDGRRARALADYGPAPARLAALAGWRGMGIVLSPAVDLADPGLPPGGELEFLQRGPDLVESMLWLGDLARPATRASATLLAADASVETLHRAGDPVALPTGTTGDYAVSVAPAAVRARLHGELGAAIGARRIATRRALLTCDRLPQASPWYRVSEVRADLPARPRAVRRWLQTNAHPAIELASAGLEVDLESWWRELGRPQRGPNGWRLQLLRTDDGARALILAPVAQH